MSGLGGIMGGGGGGGAASSIDVGGGLDDTSFHTNEFNTYLGETGTNRPMEEWAKRMGPMWATSAGRANYIAGGAPPITYGEGFAPGEAPSGSGRFGFGPRGAQTSTGPAFNPEILAMLQRAQRRRPSGGASRPAGERGAGASERGAAPPLSEAALMAMTRQER